MSRLKWKYKDHERPKVAECYDCGSDYRDTPDMIIDNNLWELINPTYHKGAGILCPRCTTNRLRLKGVNEFTARFAVPDRWK